MLDTLALPSDPLLGATTVTNTGPSVITEQPALFWGIVVSMWIGNLLLVVLNLPLIGLWVRMLAIPYHLLYPAMLFFICIGVYSVNNSGFDVWMVVVLGALGYLFRIADLPESTVKPVMEEFQAEMERKFTENGESLED